MQHEQHLQQFFRDSDVLVTGGMGFLGSHLVARLRELGARVTLVDLDTSPGRQSHINDVPGLAAGVKAVQGDIGDIAVVRSLFESTPFKAVFNLASFASTIERAVDHPYQTIRTSTMGLVNVLEMVRTSKNPPVSVVHTSTDKVYGEVGDEPYDEERTPLRAEGVYDVAKLAADALANMYHRAYRVPATVLRLCNVFGPADYNTNYRVVPRAMKAIFGGAAPQPPSLYAGSVRHERDYVYVDDCIRAILTLAADASCRGKVYNLMGCAHLRTPEIIQAVIDAAVQVETRFDAGKAAVIGRNGFTVVEESVKAAITISNQHMTGERLQRDTGFAPEFSLQEGLARTAMFYREHFHAGERAPDASGSIKSVQSNA